MAKKTKKNRLYRRYTKRKLLFRNIRFSILYLILLAAIGFGFYKVYSYIDQSLTAYESAQWRYVAEDMAQMFVDRDFDKLYAYEDATKLDIETKDDYVHYLNSLTEGTYITYKEVGTREADERKFSVTSNGKSFASFSIKKSGESMDCGLLGVVDLYEFGSVSTDVIQPITYQVTLPDYASLFVNGKAIGSDKIIESGIETFASGHLPDGYPSYTLSTYRFTAALGIPVIEAKDESGNVLVLTETSQDEFTYEFSFMDDELRPIHEKYVTEVAQKMCQFMTQKTSKDSVLRLMKKDSAAAKAINETNAMWLTEAKKHNFRNIRTENYFQYSDEIFSCELYLDYDIVAKNNAETSYPFHIRFFVQKVGNDWKVYDFLYI
ncbi:MAG: hypothetical protein IKJ65_07615 [Clostridia bacterium]|nr:hypothetical protein [Clostridia bacterium]